MAYILSMPDNIMNFDSTAALGSYDVSLTVNGQATGFGTLASVTNGRLYQYRNNMNGTWVANGTTVINALRGGAWVDFFYGSSLLGNPQCYVLVNDSNNTISGTSVTLNANQVTKANLATTIAAQSMIVASGTAAYAGGGTTTTITVAGSVAGDLPYAQLTASTNNVSITKTSLSGTTLTVTFSADPGAATSINYWTTRLTS